MSARRVRYAGGPATTACTVPYGSQGCFGALRSTSSSMIGGLTYGKDLQAPDDGRLPGTTQSLPTPRGLANSPAVAYISVNPSTLTRHNSTQFRHVRLDAPPIFARARSSEEARSSVDDDTYSRTYTHRTYIRDTHDIQSRSCRDSLDSVRVKIIIGPQTRRTILARRVFLSCSHDS